MDKLTFKFHPIAILHMLKSYWYILSVPYVRMIVQRLFLDEVVKILWSERMALFAIMIFVVLKWFTTKISVTNKNIEITRGVFVKVSENIKTSHLFCIVTEQTALGVIFGFVNCYIDLEQGVVNGKNSKFKISVRKAEELCKIIYTTTPKGELKIKRKKSRYFTIPITFIAVTLFLWVIINCFGVKARYSLDLLIVLFLVEVYYLLICYYDYRQAKVCFGDVIFAQGSKALKIYKIYYLKSKTGIYKISQNPIDRHHNTYKMCFMSCSKIGNVFKVKNIDALDVEILNQSLMYKTSEQSNNN